jgi:uncharacterized tellurite resistance protein B-like protein
MFDRLKAWLIDPAAEMRGAAGDSDRRYAAAGLLVVAARMDEAFSPPERAAILRLLRERFALSESQAAELMGIAERRAEQSQQIFPLTQIVEESFSPAERIDLMEMLWEVVYADGRLDEYEANLLRRIAGLIHVGDGDSGAARKRVLSRLGRD